MSLYFSIHIFSFRNSSRWPTNIINSVDKIKWSALAKAYKLILFGVKDTVNAKKIQNKRQNGENVENNRLMKRCFIVTCLVSSTPRRNVFRCENIFIQTRGICYWKLKQRLLGLCIKHSYPPPPRFSPFSNPNTFSFPQASYFESLVHFLLPGGHRRWELQVFQ